MKAAPSTTPEKSPQTTAVGPTDGKAAAAAVLPPHDGSSTGKSSGMEDDEDLANRLWPLFMARTKQGAINLQDLVAISEELGMESDTATFGRVVRQEKQDCIFFEEAVQYLQLALRSAHEDVFENQGDGEGGPKKIQVSPWAVASHKLGCTQIMKKDHNEFGDEIEVEAEEDEYEVDWSQCMSAKALLLLTTFVVFVGVAAGIISFSSITWLDGALARERSSLSSFQSTLTLFAEALESRFITAHGVSIEDTTNTLARFIEFKFEKYELGMQNDTVHECAIVSELMSTSTKSFKDDIRATFGKKISSINAVAPHVKNLNKMMIIQVLSDFQRNFYEEFKVLWELQVNDTFAGAVVLNFKDPRAASLSQYCSVNESNPTTYTGYLALPNAVVVRAFVPSTRLGVCGILFLPNELQYLQSRAAETVDFINALPRDDVEGSTEVTEVSLWQLDELGTGGVSSITKLHEDERFCRVISNDCSDFFSFVKNVFSNSTPGEIKYGLIKYYNGEKAETAGTYIAELDRVVLLARPKVYYLDSFRSRVISTMEFLNWAFVRTTELVIGGIDQATNRIVPQATSFRFADTCLGGPFYCSRFAEAANSAYDAMRNNFSGQYIAPDYRPQPVVTTYSKIASDINSPLVIERDVSDLRGIILTDLIEIVEDINRVARSILEVVLVRYDAYPVCKLFDPYQPCPPNEYCISRPGVGIVFRSDCVDCMQRPPITANSSFSYLTNLRFLDRCPDAELCEDKDWLQNNNNELARLALSLEPKDVNADVVSQMVTDNDYTGERVIAVVSFLKELSTGIIVKVYALDVEVPITTGIAIAAACAAALTLVGLILVLLSTQRILRKIDEDWRNYKTQVEAEKDKFAAFVQYFVPRHILRRFKNGHAMVAEASPNASICFIDMCGFSDLSKGWSSKQYFLFTNYYFFAVDELASVFGIFKLKTFGDVFVGVSGFGRHQVDQLKRTTNTTSTENTSSQVKEGSSKKSGSHRSHHDDTSGAGSGSTSSVSLHASQQPPVLNMGYFATMLLQLLSNEFTHYINKYAMTRLRMMKSDEKNAAAAKNDILSIPTAEMRMPQIRIGLHVGPMVSGYLDVGRTPKFDCFGPSMQMAHRMQLTCPPDRIHCTTFFKEELEVVDVNECFEYDPARKTIVKGRGTVVSYLMKSAHVPVSEHFLAKLKITHAHKAFEFPIPSDLRGSNTGSKTGSRTRSKHSGGSSGTPSVASSQRSGASKHSGGTY